MTRKRLLGAVALIGLITAGCAGDAELDTLQPQSDNARDIDTLLDRVLVIAGVIGVLVLGAVVYMAKKQRVKSYDGDDEFPEQISHNNTLEIGWTIVPAIIMVVVAVLTTVAHFSLNETEANAYEVEVEGDSTSWEPKVVVVGHQWWWEFRYYFSEDVDGDMLGDPRNLPPADIVTSGQMIIPTGEEIELLVTSRDVIHSFWIPALNGKRDARPGFYAPWKIEADNPGVYFGQCTEFCGLSHSRMRMQVVAMDGGDFQNWIDEQMVPQSARRRTPTTPSRVAPRHSSPTARRATWSRVSMAMRTSPLPWSRRPRRTSPTSPAARPSPAASSTPTPRMASGTATTSRSGCEPPKS